MKIIVKYAAVFVAAVLVSAGIMLGLILSGVVDLAKLKYQLHYHPWVTANNPVEIISTIETNQFRLKAHSFSLASMGAHFISGGGTILPRPDGSILVLNKSGGLFQFRRNASGPELRDLRQGVKTNNDLYGHYARSKGYAVRPGSNVGFVGLGMRAIDLLYLKQHSLLAISYTRWLPERHCAVLKISVRGIDAQLNFESSSSWKDIFESSPCVGLSHRKVKPFAGHQSGGRMIESPGGNLLVTVGDFKHDGWNREAITNAPNVDYGKVFEVNPLNGERKLFTSGHRNPQGLMIDTSGAVWSTEHGPIGGDELNKLVRGRNYGWPNVTLGMNCASCDWLLNGRHDGFPGPVFSWSPAIGISNLIQIKGFDKSWNGDFMVASLRGHRLHRLRFEKGHVQQDEPIVIGERIRDLYQAADSEIVLWTDSGKLIFLSRDLSPTISEKIIASLTPAARETIRRCAGCHVFEEGQIQVGSINLWGVYGRDIASTDFPDHSDAFKSRKGVWDQQRLDEYLENPQGAIPNSAMADEGIADKSLRAEIIGFLRRLN